jgi:cell division protein FtsA
MMMKKKDFVVGLDIGSKKISGCIGRLDKHDKINIAGASSVSSKGIKNGIVIDIKELTDSIENLIKQLEKISELKMSSVYANIAGSHIKTHIAKGHINIADRDNEITRLDISRVIDIAKNTSIPVDRHILHIFPSSFIVDDQFGIKDPIGMFGRKLEVELTIITALPSATQNITKSIRASGVDIEELIFSGFATGNAVLREHERELGVVLVDIGAFITEIVVFWDNNIKFTEIIPIGGDYITESISKELKVSFEYAEFIKKRFGCVSSKKIPESEKFILKDGRWQKGITKKYLCEIIEPTLNDMLSQIKSRIDKLRFLKKVTFGVVFSGGTSLMEDFLEVAEEILGMPVRIGTARDIFSNRENVNNYEYLTSIGLVKHGLLKKYKRINPVSLTFLDRIKYKCKVFIEEYF